MRFQRRNRFWLIFLALLAFCSAMMVGQFIANQRKHVELRERFIERYREGYWEEAARLYERLVRDLEVLPDKTLRDDSRRTLVLVDPTNQQSENLIWRYHGTVSNELVRRFERALRRAGKLGNDDK
jgi:FMN phosphatase YigB (HAD superfamily)